MVSIIPGMDIAEPERTDTSNGFSPLPNPRPVFFSRAAMCARTSSITPSGRCRSAWSR